MRLIPSDFTEDETDFSFCLCENITFNNIDICAKYEDLDQFNYFFTCCDNLKTLDISSIDFSNVKNADGLFVGCQELTTIYASDSVSFASCDEEDSIFGDNGKLVGGKGTSFDGATTNKALACIDDPDHGKPGYFTSVTAKK